MKMSSRQNQKSNPMTYKGAASLEAAKPTQSQLMPIIEQHSPNDTLAKGTIDISTRHDGNNINVGDGVSANQPSNLNGIVKKNDGLLYCNSCNQPKCYAKGKCFKCLAFLCENCIDAHEQMVIFEDHDVQPLELSDIVKSLPKVAQSQASSELNSKLGAKFEEQKKCVGYLANNLFKAIEMGTESLQANSMLKLNYQNSVKAINNLYNDFLFALNEQKTKVMKQIIGNYKFNLIISESQLETSLTTIKNIIMLSSGNGFNSMSNIRSDAIALEGLLKVELRNLYDPPQLQPLIDKAFAPNSELIKKFITQQFSDMSALTRQGLDLKDEILSDENSSNDSDTETANGMVKDSGRVMTKCMDSTAPTFLDPVTPFKIGIFRTRISFLYKFGGYGTFLGKFKEPNDVAINDENEIIIADASNHRIQIFDSTGCFTFQFNDRSDRDNPMIYPNCVAVLPDTGDIIVATRNPYQRIKVFDRSGRLIRQFGQDYLKYPRGITVDKSSRILIIESKIMRVSIFDKKGNNLKSFCVSDCMVFPNSIVVNDKFEIFICDNLLHSVKVFNYDGCILRNIGQRGITNFPIGARINKKGEMLIIDNHHSLNFSLFSKDGQLISTLQSKIRHQNIYNFELLDDDKVVLTSKDCCVYVYRYKKIPPKGDKQTNSNLDKAYFKTM